jgi:carbohydrate kinase (thermoresistant glucokinase family)
MTIREDFVIVMGVSGSGKTEIARRLAAAFNGSWLDADDFHPVENVEHMRQGRPLNDDMRWPWLDALCRAAIETHATHTDEQPVFIACSALKRRYRDFMRDRLGPFPIIFLDGTRDLIVGRMDARQGHFMPSRLLDSQFNDLEPPGPDEDSLTVPIEAPIDAVTEIACRALIERPDRPDADKTSRPSAN